METISRCKICGRMWDDDGCQIQGMEMYEVEEFVCERCERDGINE